MRPGRIHPGNRVPDVLTAAAAFASMRPGRIHPGNRDDRDQYDRWFNIASMRPGRIHPGNLTIQRRTK